MWGRPPAQSNEGKKKTRQKKTRIAQTPWATRCRQSTGRNCAAPRNTPSPPPAPPRPPSQAGSRRGEWRHAALGDAPVPRCCRLARTRCRPPRPPPPCKLRIRPPTAKLGRRTSDQTTAQHGGGGHLRGCVARTNTRGSSGRGSTSRVSWPTPGREFVADMRARRHEHPGAHDSYTWQHALTQK